MVFGGVRWVARARIGVESFLGRGKVNKGPYCLDNLRLKGAGEAMGRVRNSNLE